jgi:hypothetical protein
MRLKKSSLSGGIEFPVLPVLLVVILVAMILGHQALSRVSFISGFKVEAEDIESTSSTPLPDKKMDLTLRLTRPGAARLAEWAGSHPGGEVPITFNGIYLGTIKLTPGMDTQNLHLIADTSAVLPARYALGK